MNSVSDTRYGGPRVTPSGLFGFREARALNQAAPAVDLRLTAISQAGRRYVSMPYWAKGEPSKMSGSATKTGIWRAVRAWYSAYGG